MSYKYTYRGKLGLYYETGMEGHHAAIVMEDRGWHGLDNKYHDLNWSHWFGRRQCDIAVFDEHGKEIYHGPITWDRSNSERVWTPNEIEQDTWIKWLAAERSVILYTNECMRADPAYPEYEKELAAKREAARLAEDNRPRKQVIVLRKDLNMRKGKMIAQGAHASLLAFSAAQASEIEKWMVGGYTKVAVSCDSETQLMVIYQAALDAKLAVRLITDAGRTEFNGVPTMTAVAIGPGPSDEIDLITGQLKLL